MELHWLWIGSTTYYWPYWKVQGKHKVAIKTMDHLHVLYSHVVSYPVWKKNVYYPRAVISDSWKSWMKCGLATVSSKAMDHQSTSLYDSRKDLLWSTMQAMLNIQPMDGLTRTRIHWMRILRDSWHDRLCHMSPPCLMNISLIMKWHLAHQHLWIHQQRTHCSNFAKALDHFRL